MFLGGAQWGGLCAPFLSFPAPRLLRILPWLPDIPIYSKGNEQTQGGMLEAGVSTSDGLDRWQLLCYLAEWP